MLPIQTQTLQTVCEALQNTVAVDFIRGSVRAGYHQCFSAPVAQIDALVDTAFDQLAHSQQGVMDHDRLTAVTVDLLPNVFKKGDASFWFNQQYHAYKTRAKPETDFQQLRSLIVGQRILDYGCGSGYLAARLAQGGYQMFTTDVLDYRYAEAKALPFVQMTTPTDIAYPDGSIDTALIQAVLHHIGPAELPQVLQRLGRIARYLVIKEDTFAVPASVPGLVDTLNRQPLLQAFLNLPLPAQYQVLVLIDFYANAIAQGIPEMNMPFAFRSVAEWWQVLEANGFKVTQTRVVGFEPGRMHQSCHAWFVCEAVGRPV